MLFLLGDPLPWAPASSLHPGSGLGGCLSLFTLKAKVLGRAIWGSRWAWGSPRCDRGQAGGAASASLASRAGCGTHGTKRGGPGPQGQLWGAELPREARVWARALTCPMSPGGGQNSQMVMSKEGRAPAGCPPWGSQQSPLLIQAGPALGLAHPCRAPVRETTPPWPRVLPLTSFSLRHGGAGALLLLPPLPPECPGPSCLCGCRQDSHVGWEFGLRRFHLGAEGHGALAGGTCRLPGRGARGLGSGRSRRGAAGLSQRS